MRLFNPCLLGFKAPFVLANFMKSTLKTNAHFVKLDVGPIS